MDAGDTGVEDAPTGPVYPPEPYGSAVNDTLENLSFSGYLKLTPGVVDPMVDEYVEGLSFQQIRETGAYDYMILNIAAEWCAGCRVEANQLPPLYNDWASRGGFVMSVLTENTASLRARRRHLDSWVANFPINYTMVHDPGGGIITTFGYDTLPLNVIVRLEDMQVLAVVFGEDPSVFTRFSNLLQP